MIVGDRLVSCSSFQSRIAVIIGVAGTVVFVVK